MSATFLGGCHHLRIWLTMLSMDLSLSSLPQQSVIDHITYRSAHWPITELQNIITKACEK
jgi:hypothetical protein